MKEREREGEREGDREIKRERERESDRERKRRGGAHAITSVRKEDGGITKIKEHTKTRCRVKGRKDRKR